MQMSGLDSAQLELIDGPLSLVEWLQQNNLDGVLQLWNEYQAAQSAALRAQWHWHAVPTWANEDAARTAAEYVRQLQPWADAILAAYWQYDSTYPRKWRVHKPPG